MQNDRKGEFVHILNIVYLLKNCTVFLFRALGGVWGGWGFVLNDVNDLFEKFVFLGWR